MRMSEFEKEIIKEYDYWKDKYDDDTLTYEEKLISKGALLAMKKVSALVLKMTDTFASII